MIYCTPVVVIMPYLNLLPRKKFENKKKSTAREPNEVLVSTVSTVYWYTGIIWEHHCV
jgi:hypothetical protein